ncbi:tyrosine-type recombinase/integrase [Stenotrophomonas maltophilia]|uniref:tyrosine-type recombinase/integrase n=1 Tax=Stenotrophomonas maltophilia TaxID=40324 RepID=UPI003CF0B751
MAKVRLYWRGSKAYLDWAEGGERFRRSIGQPDAREAERIRAAKEAELTHGVRILARLPKVRDYLEWYLDWYEAEHPTTISKARSEVKRFIERFVTVHKDTVSDWFKKDSELAGVGGHLHRLRHTFCAHMVMAGVPLRRVQILAGHADYATTEKYYAHLTPDGDDGAVSNLKF